MVDSYPFKAWVLVFWGHALRNNAHPLNSFNAENPND